jgi:hypothetical protein
MNKKVIIGSTVLLVIGILFFAIKKKKEQDNLNNDVDFQAVLDKIDKAPK